MDFTEQFRTAMAQDGISYVGEFIADAALHRIHVEGDNPSNFNGWYILHDGQIAAGAYGCWKRGISQRWSSKPIDQMTSAEQSQYRQRMNEIKSAADAARDAAHKKAQVTAQSKWAKAKPADPNHPYLKKKEIAPGTLRIEVDTNALLIPICNSDKQIQSLQSIFPDGTKRFLTDGAIKGNYFSFGKLESPTDRLYITEGYATGVTVNIATGCATACAFNCHNLLAVGQALRAKFPNAELIFVADNDQWSTDGKNVGISKATEAAQALNAKVLYPVFTGLDTNDKPTDFNDLACLAGLDEVKRQLTPPSEQPSYDDPCIESATQQRPKIDEEAFFGILKSFVETSRLNSEASNVGVAANVIAHLCARINRKAYICIGDANRHCRPFFLLVGSSGKARKGSAGYLAKRVFEVVEKIFEKDNPYYRQLHIHTGGLSSGEGVGYAIRDASDDPKSTDQGIADKRLLVIESEFANIFVQCKREKSTLSTTIRSLFDGEDLEPLTKTNRVKVTDPHVVILGNITQLELNSMSGVLEATNGFLNRFLICFVERGDLVPIPKKTPDNKIMELAHTMADILIFIDDQASQSNGSFEVGFTEEAEKLWIEIYPTLSQEQPGLIGALTARIEFYARMLSMIFCLLDKRTQVEVKHLKAALLWVDYGSESVEHIFDKATTRRHESDTQEIADRIIKLLKTSKRVTRTDINKSLNGHVPATKINEAVMLLVNAKPPMIRIDTVETGGKSKQIFELLTAE